MQIYQIDILDLLNDYEENLLKSDECPAAVDGHKLKLVGMTLAQISLGNKKVKEEIHFLKGMKGLVLSWKTVQKLGIIPGDYPKQINAVSDANGNRSCANQPCREPFESQTTKTVNPPIASKIPRLVAFKAKTPPVANPTKDDLIKEFPEVFYGKVTVMPSETFKTELTADAKPYCITNPRPLPFAYKELLKKELDKLQAAGIITPVSKPTNWCLHSVVAPKKNGEIRLCIDFHPLNKFVKCEHYQITWTLLLLLQALKHHRLKYSLL